MIYLAALAFSWQIASLAAALGGFLILGIANLTAPSVSVQRTLRAGRFNVPLEVIGELEVLESEQLRQVLGPRANPAARYVIRGDIRRALKIEITDPEDPTPYLVISSRNPESLAVAINANRT